jgi:Zn-dependent M28 family amino/carboxypeptidase
MKALAMLLAALALAGCDQETEPVATAPATTATTAVEEPGETTVAAPATVEEAITAEGLLAHLQALDEIAEANDGTRESGSPGYEASVEYVVAELEAAGYEARLKRFRFTYPHELEPPRFERVSPRPQAYRHERQFLSLRYSGSGTARARLVPVDTAGVSSGCESSDFAGFPRGAVALVARSGCFFYVKAQNAETAGAAAVVIFNDGSPGREGPLAGTLLRPGAGIPVLGLAHAPGERLARQAARGAVTVRVAARVRNEKKRIANVVADLPGSEDGGVVLLGAHLDSVAQGPGINDNGSGVATVLEAARQLRALGERPRRGLRFAFWAAEEFGLYGSRAYVERLGEDAAEEIAAVLNFDMVGSPNFGRYVYDGHEAGLPSGSARIERAFRAYFREREIEAAEVAIAGRSDHAPFAERGIPVGGLFTGADDEKTRSEARRFGGERGEPHDACYHKACDTIENIDSAVLEVMAEAAAATALRLSR